MKRFFSLLLMLLTAIVVEGAQTTPEWYVEKFGAKADGVTLNTKAIQRAVDECSKNGGGRVVLSSGVYRSGTIELKDNVTLEVRRSAVLRGTINPLDYRNIDPFVDATGQSRGECLVGAINAKNVGITGYGTIDGMGEYFMAQLTRARLKSANHSEDEIAKYSSVRPFLLRFVGSEGVVIEDVSLTSPGAWTCHLFECSKIKVKGVRINAHVNKNNDGIDLDSCDGAEITDCDIDTGDDALCFKSTSPKPCQNVVVKRCRLRSDWGAIKFGTESMGDFKNITINDCDIVDTQGGGIKVLSVDGANIYNVRISKIRMSNVDMPIFIRLGERLRTYRDAPKQPVGSIDHLYITGITATTRPRATSRVNPPSGILITGTPNARIGFVHLQGIDITLPGGGTAEDVKRKIAEDEKRYPEFSFFGVQPAYGLNARHIDSLQMKAVSFRLTGVDARDISNIYDVNYVPLEFPAPIE